MKTLFRFVTALLFSLLFFACAQDGECRLDRYVVMKADFYTIETDTETEETSVKSLAIDSLTVYGLGLDSLLANNSKKTTSIVLPLNKLALQSDFVFLFNEVRDTVSLFYDTNEDFLSFECGVVTTFTLSDRIETTHHFIDSVKVITHDVHTTITENVQIYHTDK